IAVAITITIAIAIAIPITRPGRLAESVDRAGQTLATGRVVDAKALEVQRLHALAHAHGRPSRGLAGPRGHAMVAEAVLARHALVGLGEALVVRRLVARPGLVRVLGLGVRASAPTTQHQRDEQRGPQKMSDPPS